ncbi:glycoside hydrolase family 108 protein [Candidatus Cytomitobacter primus]|uniref:Peptidoglycan-binding protein n=1 Tax=Candidatus Cytomitobacter primus TaxID=2066024 RepID=A0A5C0UEX2_9PROT|nr:glycosyl hydrolase 108 family protein [Candidatus Cytomitobacter primus]QEK38646.1 peptidoglycan-binding protein [Candidatus Cytomitobacter primus]
MVIYSNKFKKAMNVLLEHEGGYVNDQYDRGGETKYGISKKVHQNIDIERLTIETATEIYYKYYWCTWKYDKIDDDVIANKVFNLGVNLGNKNANKLLQRALRATGVHIDEDGILGTKSIATINEANSYALLCALRSEAANYYRIIVMQNANQNRFINGWLNRAYF